MTNNFSPQKIIKDIANVAAKQKLDVYLVGGYLRDRLLKLPFAGEMDFSVIGNAPLFAQAVADHLKLNKSIQIFQRFGTAHLQAGEISLEFAGARKESYDEHSRNPQVEPATFEEDIARRDFTINTLAANVHHPAKIIDLFNGRDDLKKKIIRTPLEPEKTFHDDPLRILRAIRFAAKFKFNIERKTAEALKTYRERLKIVARERINDEFFKILACDPPSLGLHLLFISGVLEIIFPEIAAMAGVEPIGQFQHKDVLYHSFLVVDKVAEQTERLDLRFAALVHDIGKPKTKRFDPENGWTFHGHEHLGERMIQSFRKNYQLPEDLIIKTSHLVRLHMRPLALQDEGVTDSAIRRLVVQAGEQVDDLFLLCRADITSGNKNRVMQYLESFDRMVERIDEIERKDELRRFQSPIRGDEIMEYTGLPEGPRIGLIKALIEEAILEGTIEFSSAAAKKILDEVIKTVESLPDDQVLGALRKIMRARADGIEPPISRQEG